MAKGSNKTLYILGIVAVVLVGGAIAAKQMGMIGGKELTKVTTEEVSKKTIIETVNASGKIYPKVEVKISPDVSGEITELFIEEGDSVKEGQLLLKIRPDIYASMVDRANASLNTTKANMASSRAQLAQSQAQYDNTISGFKRNEILYNEGVISAVEFETSQTSMKTAKASLGAAQQNVRAAEFNIKSAQASLKEARDNYQKTQIFAPMSGVISSLNVEQGERVVGTSQMAGTEILRIANFDYMEARVDVSENDVLRVNPGDTALIEIDAYLDREFKGLVTQVANSANTGMSATSNVTNFVVKIQLLKSSYEDLFKEEKIPFRPGMSASVDVMTERAEGIIVVPIQSVTTREDEKDDSKTEEMVFVLEGNTVLTRKVKTGIQDDKNIQIRKGLKPGETVITAPYTAISKELKNEMEVEVVDKEDLYKSEKKGWGK